MSEENENKEQVAEPAVEATGGQTSGGSASSSGTEPAARRRIMFRRRKSCPLSGKKAPVVDYKNPKLLSRFIMADCGKIMPSRVTSTSRKQQRRLTTAIKRARFLALLPYTFHRGQ